MMNSFWVTVCKRFALCYRTVVSPVCPILSVTLVYCGQTVGRIKIKLGVQAGLSPGHIMLHGTIDREFVTSAKKNREF